MVILSNRTADQGAVPIQNALSAGRFPETNGLEDLMFRWSAGSRGAHLPGCPYLRATRLRTGDWRQAALNLRRPCRHCAGRFYLVLTNRFDDLLIAAAARVPADISGALPADVSAAEVHRKAAAARRRAFEEAGPWDR